jgi:hypothetical protein
MNNSAQLMLSMPKNSAYVSPRVPGVRRYANVGVVVVWQRIEDTFRWASPWSFYQYIETFHGKCKQLSWPALCTIPKLHGRVQTMGSPKPVRSANTCVPCRATSELLLYRRKLICRSALSHGSCWRLTCCHLSRVKHGSTVSTNHPHRP